MRLIRTRGHANGNETLPPGLTTSLSPWGKWNVLEGGGDSSLLRCLGAYIKCRAEATVAGAGDWHWHQLCSVARQQQHRQHFVGTKNDGRTTLRANVKTCSNKLKRFAR